jgi:hypothetical protein
MLKKVRHTQEEEILQILKREGFEELSEDDVKKEPFKSIYKWPDCFKREFEVQTNEK